jgi:hypothetical protein
MRDVIAARHVYRASNCYTISSYCAAEGFKQTTTQMIEEQAQEAVEIASELVKQLVGT